ncbi:MAG TPA: hypothetical protein DDZ53_09910 [Firmicutes bacterium]|jgi:hypothetical protein|nr:hypothetical protein [Bacillota bacterium]
MRVISVILALMLFALPNLVKAAYVHLGLAMFAVAKIGLPTLYESLAFLAALAFTPVCYSLSILITNLGLPQFKLKAKVPFSLRSLTSVFMVSLLEELSWRVTILEAVDLWLWRVGTSFYFVYLHFRKEKQVVIMEWVELLLFTGILVWLVRVFETPWIGVGLHFGRNIASTIISLEGSEAR